MMNADAGRVFDPYVLKVFFEQVAPRLTWRTADLSASPAEPPAPSEPDPAAATDHPAPVVESPNA